MRIPLFIFATLSLFVSCVKEDTPEPYTYVPEHIPPVYSVSLAGQTWVLTQYHDTMMSTVVPAGDTLVFTDSVNYTWNGFPCEYTLKYDSAYVNTQWYFVLYNTPFGTLSAYLPPSCFTYGNIPDKLFRCSPSGAYYMWFERQ